MPRSFPLSAAISLAAACLLGCTDRAPIVLLPEAPGHAPAWTREVSDAPAHDAARSRLELAVGSASVRTFEGSGRGISTYEAGGVAEPGSGVPATAGSAGAVAVPAGSGEVGVGDPVDGISAREPDAASPAPAFGSPEEAAPSSMEGAPSRGPGGTPIDLNLASAEELESLPRVGPALALRIIAGRPYRSIEQLATVRGIGPRTMELLRPLVDIAP